MIEIAIAGLVALLLAGVAITKSPLGNEDPTALRRLAPALLGLSAVVYFLCVQNHTPRQYVALAAALIFCGKSTAILWRSQVPPSAKGSWVNRWVKTTLRTFFCSAPILLATTDRGIPPFEWLDILAGVLWVYGLYLLIRRKDDDRMVLGAAAGSMAFYVLAVSSSSGFLTLFAPLLYVHDFRQTLCPLRDRSPRKKRGVEAKTPHGEEGEKQK
jgi:hypothetical protein